MCAVGEDSSSLASKCMDFCQALANQGEAFNFSLSIGSNFSFSLDTRSEEGKKSLKPRSQVLLLYGEMLGGDKNI